jgi:hypothetical protein
LHAKLSTSCNFQTSLFKPEGLDGVQLDVDVNIGVVDVHLDVAVRQDGAANCHLLMALHDHDRLFRCNERKEIFVCPVCFFLNFSFRKARGLRIQKS